METQNGPKFCIGKDNGFEHFKLKFCWKFTNEKRKSGKFFNVFILKYTKDISAKKSKSPFEK